MKYIKIYEDMKTPFSYFYYISYIDKTLFKLAINKMPIENKLKIEIIKDSKTFINKYHIGVFICTPDYYIYETSYTYYTVSNSKDFKNGYDLYIKNDAIYKGEIKLEDYEIAAIKYNL
jgi:hypothetical protein